MRRAAVLTQIVLQAVAVFQVALAFGAPWGEHAYGGRAKTRNGQLTPPYRVMSGLAVPILLFASWIVLAKADLVTGGGDWVNVAVWFVFGYLVLNTATNFASSSKVERYVIGTATALAAVCTLIVALG